MKIQFDVNSKDQSKKVSPMIPLDSGEIDITNVSIFDNSVGALLMNGVYVNHFYGYGITRYYVDTELVNTTSFLILYYLPIAIRIYREQLLNELIDEVTI